MKTNEFNHKLRLKIGIIANSILPIILFIFLSLLMISCKTTPLEIITESLPDGNVGIAYYAKVESGGRGDEFFLSGGTLPPGIQLSDSGVLSGTPTIAGTYIFTIALVDYKDEGNDYAYKGFSIIIH